jgi:ATP-dependent DNA helicase RecQ
MPSLTRIVCLANSRKHGARCIAGIELSTGRWIRPVSELDDGRVERGTRMIDGREPAPGDVIEIPLSSTGPDYGFECENRAILPGPWRGVRRMSVPEIRRLKSDGATVLHGVEPFVDVHYLQSLQRDDRRTLQLVEVDDLAVFSTGFSANGGHKWKASFSVGSGLYTCMVTDPVLMDRLESGYRPGCRALLTVSLSMPYRPTEWDRPENPCWKLIAAVIELDAVAKEGRDGDARALPAGASVPARPDAPARARIDERAVTQALERFFGYRAFRPGQADIIRAIIEGRDVFAVMPTGGGKSLCYQLPACLLPGACLVISPLIALMKDQVDAARACGIRAACLNSSQNDADRIAVLGSLESGKLDLLYVSPERFAMDQFLTLLGRVSMCLVAIDEAHCISEWGHEFRPDYLFLSEVVTRFPHVPLAAFTATATGQVQQNIVSRLKLRHPHLHRASFDRPNLYYEVAEKTDPVEQIAAFVSRRSNEAGIVYRLSRKDVERTAAHLVDRGINALPYHAGLNEASRTANQDAFSRDRAQVMVATIAFGMGINKSNIRFVVHGDMPKSIENYYQETGRAGRDGDPAHCLLLYGRGDIARIRYFIDKAENETERQRASRALQDMIAFASATTCRRGALLAYFGEAYGSDNCAACDACTVGREVVDITDDARKVLAVVDATGERFGTVHIVGILTGSRRQSIVKFGHDALPVYGSGTQRTLGDWREIVDSMVQQGVLNHTGGGRPVLCLTQAGRAVLGCGRRVTLMRKAADTVAPVKALPKPAGLFEELRSLRTLIAGELNVPAYVVFSDRTLHEMVGRLPRDGREMLLVNGVGEVKLARFGARFLAAIGSHRRREGLDCDLGKSQPPPGSAPLQRYLPSGQTGGTYRETLGLLREGLSIEEIAVRRDLTRGTIASHIEQLLCGGIDINIDFLVSPDRRLSIEGLFDRYGMERLAPIVEASGSTVTFDDARIVRAWLGRAHASPKAVPMVREDEAEWGGGTGAPVGWDPEQDSSAS